jgi:hypothetical protein
MALLAKGESQTAQLIKVALKIFLGKRFGIPESLM